MSTYAYIQHIYGEPQLLNVFISNTWDFGSKEDVGIGSNRQQVNGVLVDGRTCQNQCSQSLIIKVCHCVVLKNVLIGNIKFIILKHYNTLCLIPAGEYLKRLNGFNLISILIEEIRRNGSVPPLKQQERNAEQACCVFKCKCHTLQFERLLKDN